MRNKKKYLKYLKLVGIFLILASTLTLVVIGLIEDKPLNLEDLKVPSNLEVQGLPLQQPQETEEQKIIDEQTKEYYAVYQNPYVIQIRTTLNSYLKDPGTVSAGLSEKGLTMGKKTGLDNFSSDYYKGRFVVMTIANSVVGGKEINILFPDKPDQVFWVLVYKLSGGEYDMRGFAESPNWTQEQLEDFIKENTQLINDIEHSL